MNKCFDDKKVAELYNVTGSDYSVGFEMNDYESIPEYEELRSEFKKILHSDVDVDKWMIEGLMERLNYAIPNHAQLVILINTIKRYIRQNKIKSLLDDNDN